MIALRYDMVPEDTPETPLFKVIPVPKILGGGRNTYRVARHSYKHNYILNKNPIDAEFSVRPYEGYGPKKNTEDKDDCEINFDEFEITLTMARNRLRYANVLIRGISCGKHRQKYEEQVVFGQYDEFKKAIQEAKATIERAQNSLQESLNRLETVQLFLEIKQNIIENIAYKEFAKFQNEEAKKHPI